MTWIQRHRLRQYFKDSIWIAPSLGIVAAIILSRFSLWVDRTVGWQMDLQPDAARTVLIALAAAAAGAATAAGAQVPAGADWPAGEQTSSIPARRDGVILACDIDGIVATAEHAGCVLEMIPQVGDFVSRGTSLFNVYGDSQRL